jgi:hypothetical protein
VLTTQTPGFAEDLDWLSPLNPVLIPLVHINAREAVTSLWRLDQAMVHIICTVKEPALRQIRLAWWRESLLKLDQGIIPPEPILQNVAQHLLPLLPMQDIADMIDAWEDLYLASPDDSDAIMTFSAQYGARLYGFTAQIMGHGSTHFEQAGTRFAIVRHAMCFLAGKSAMAEVQDNILARSLTKPLVLAPPKPRLLRALDRLMVHIANRKGARSPAREQLCLFRASLLG